jgi:hypothetical protein
MARDLKKKWEEYRRVKQALAVEKLKEAQAEAAGGSSWTAGGPPAISQHLPPGTELPAPPTSMTGEDQLKCGDCSFPVPSPVAAGSASALLDVIAGADRNVPDIALQPGYMGPLFSNDEVPGCRYNHSEWLVRGLRYRRDVEQKECHLRLARLAEGPDDWMGHDANAPDKHDIERMSRWLSLVLRHTGGQRGAMRRYLDIPTDGGGWMEAERVVEHAQKLGKGSWCELFHAASGIIGPRDRFELLLEVSADNRPLRPFAVRVRQGVSYPFVLDDRVSIGGFAKLRGVPWRSWCTAATSARSPQS